MYVGALTDLKCILSCGFHLIAVVQVSLSWLNLKQQQSAQYILAWAAWGVWVCNCMSWTLGGLTNHSSASVLSTNEKRARWAVTVGTWLGTLDLGQYPDLASRLQWLNASKYQQPDHMRDREPEATNFKIQTLNPLQRLKDTVDVKALVMHSVSGDVRMFPWLGERELWQYRDNTGAHQLGVGTGHCQDFIIKHEEGGHGHQEKSEIWVHLKPEKNHNSY